MTDFRYLFQPIDIGRVTVRNRIAITCHTPWVRGKRYIRYLEERARGGAGLIFVPAAAGVATYPIGPFRFVPGYAGDADALLPGIATDEGINYWNKTAIPMLRSWGEPIHQHGAACFAQVFHGGPSVPRGNWDPLPAPSPIPDQWLCQVPHELEVEEIERLVQISGHAARWAKEAGLDGVEIHAAHGHLVGQFMSPFTNKRTDKYGGSLENRLRFALETLEAMRDQVGTDFPIGIRITGDEFVEGGLAVQDVQHIAQMLAGKFAYISVSGGTRSGLKEGVKVAYVPPWLVPLGPFVPLAAAIREVVDIPVLVTGRINDPVQAERILAEGQADMVGMVRAFFADPEFANKAREGRLDDIRKCIGCNIGCRRNMVRRGGGLPLGCTVNAALGKEEEMELVPAPVKKRVLVAGGGPAGMETARVLALRGHDVILCEKRKELGGHIAIVTRAPMLADWADLTRFLEHQIRKLGVELRLEVEVTPELVARLNPDAVVVATGSAPYFPAIPGVDSPHVATAWQVLQGEAKIGKRVLVVGGQDDQFTPPAIADFLAETGKQVELVAATMTVGEGIEPITLIQVTKRLLEKGVVLTPMTGVKSISDGNIVVFNILTRQERIIEGIDTVVLSAGTRADNRLYRSLKGQAKELYAVGDCLAPRLTINAVLEGSRVGRLI